MSSPLATQNRSAAFRVTHTHTWVCLWVCVCACLFVCLCVPCVCVFLSSIASGQVYCRLAAALRLLRTLHCCRASDGVFIFPVSAMNGSNNATHTHTHADLAWKPGNILHIFKKKTLRRRYYKPQSKSIARMRFELYQWQRVVVCYLCAHESEKDGWKNQRGLYVLLVKYVFDGFLILLWRASIVITFKWEMSG